MKTLAKSLLTIIGLVCMPTLANAELSAPANNTATSKITIDRDAAVSLGRRLFTDSRLSANHEVSCATCHVPQKAFTDGLAKAVGVMGRSGTRNTPTLWNSGSLPSTFWDGRRSTLEEQALDPLLNRNEHGLMDTAQLLNIVGSDRAYRAAFAAAFGGSGKQIDARLIAIALAEFQRTLISTDSAFDRYYYRKQPDALSKPAARGLRLFQGRAQCASCHVINSKRAELTDHAFHSLGVGMDTVLPQLAELTQRVVAADASVLDALVAEDAGVAALGRFVVTKDPRDLGKFRTPSLRNVALTAPYMHDGSVATLDAAIESEIYYRGLQENQPLILTPRDKADLVAFLSALTSDNSIMQSERLGAQ